MAFPPVPFQEWFLRQTSTGNAALNAYVARVKADGGVVEAIGCVPLAVWDWVAPVAPTLLLDLYPNAAAAYSLRKLRAAYSGAAVRVRESGGNTEADIGFDANGDLDTSALLAHCGANDGFVTVWYDQSLSNDATQTTAARQPKIVSAGSLVTENGKPIIQRVDSASTLKTSFAPNDGAATKTLIFVGNVSPTRGTMIGSSTGGSDYVLFGQDGSGVIIVNNNTILTNEYINGTTWVYTNRNDVYDSLVNQKIVFANVQFAFGVNDMCLGYQADVTANTNMMNYQELIIYSSDELSNRTAIETNINNFYSIY